MKIKFNLLNSEPEGSGGGGGSVAPPVVPSAPDGIMGDGLAFRDNWFNDVQDPSFDEYRAMAANFKDLPSVFKSLKDTKTAFAARQDGMVKLPTEASTPEEIKAYRASIGVPESADKYGFVIPALPGGNQVEAADIKAFSEFAHKNGIPKQQAQAFLDFQIQSEAANIAAIEKDDADYARGQEEKLRGEWGHKYDANLLLAQRAAKTFGVSEEDAKNPELLRIMARVAASISEDKLAAPGDLGGGLTPGNEATDIVKNDRNPLYSIYWDTLHPRNAEVVALVMAKRKEQTRRGE